MGATTDNPPTVAPEAATEAEVFYSVAAKAAEHAADVLAAGRPASRDMVDFGIVLEAVLLDDDEIDIASAIPGFLRALGAGMGKR